MRSTFLHSPVMVFRLFNGDLPRIFPVFMKDSFWGLFKTNFYDHFRKLFLFTKFNFLNFGKKFFLTVLKSACLEFCTSNYLLKLPMMV